MMKKIDIIFSFRTLRLFLLGTAMMMLGPQVPAWAAGKQLLRGHVPKAVLSSPRIGFLPDSTFLHLAIGLPLRNAGDLQALLKNLYNPKSSQYRHFLTPEEFTAQFGPTPEDYQAVIRFAQSSGLKVEGIYLNRLLLDVGATAGDIQRIFHVTLGNYRHSKGGVFYAPEFEPSVDLDVPLFHISGLDNFHRPWSKMRKAPGRRAKIGTGAGGFYQGMDFRDLYAPNVPATLNGAGQTVALVEFGGFYQSDIAFYESSSSPSFSAPIPQTVLVAGYNGAPGNSSDDLGNNDEVSLDIEMVVSMAPGAQVLVFEAPNLLNTTSTPQYDTWANDIFAALASRPQCQQISCSWGGFGDSTTAQALTQLAAQGQAYYEASGDFGSYVDCNSLSDPNNQDPSLYLSPYEILVGGTEVTSTNPSGSPVWSSETSWNDDFGAGGGGICANFLDIPIYQTPVPMSTNGGSAQWRNMPDVSMVAAGILLVSRNQGYNGIVEGTSAASPLWAAFSALVNQQAATSGKGGVGFTNPAFYSIGLGPNYQNDFHDVADGSNNYACWTTTPTPGPYNAVSGYDLATGWGSPKGQSLINDLVAALPTLTPTPTVTPTFTPCGYPSDTCTPTFTFTPTSTPAFLVSPFGKLALAPNLIQAGEAICLYLDKAVLSSQWDVYDVAGERVAHLAFKSEKACWGHPNLASGLYLVRVRVVYGDGTTGDKNFKVILLD